MTRTIHLTNSIPVALLPGNGVPHLRTACGDQIHIRPSRCWLVTSVGEAIPIYRPTEDMLRGNGYEVTGRKIYRRHGSK